MGQGMEYAPELPKPVASGTRRIDPDTTLFVSVTGDFLYLPTQEQAEAKAAKILKKFNPDEWWAQTVSRFKVGKEEYLTAYLVKDFSKTHTRSDLANTSMNQFWFGRIEFGMTKMEFDDDSQSDTFKERVPVYIKAQMPNGDVKDVPVLDKRTYYNFLLANPKNIEMVSKMCGDTLDGTHTTEFIYVMKGGGRNVSESDQTEFFKTSIAEAEQKDRNDKKVFAATVSAAGNANKSLK